MTIHVIKEGDTINSLAQFYGVDPQRIMLDNEIKNPEDLVLGETLVILHPNIIHTVRDGDTLDNIALQYDIQVQQLLRNNPYLSERQYLYPGEQLVIDYVDEKVGSLAVNGYAYPFILPEMLKKTLPFLTYLSIYSYQVTRNGMIINIDDRELIRMAKEYGVAPVLVLSGIGMTTEEEIDVTHTVLRDPYRQEYFFDQLSIILRQKGYYGVNINTPYILPEDRELYVRFIIEFAKRMKAEGFVVFNTLSVSTFEVLTGIRYENLRYDLLGQVADYIMLISYEWGSAPGIPPGIYSYRSIISFLEESFRMIPSEKTFTGLSCIGHVWELPYVAGKTTGKALSYNAAIEIARNNHARILYDENTLAAYFQYVDKYEYIVRFRDARSMDSLIKLSSDYGVYGIGIWNIMMFFPQLWLVFNSQYDIKKVLPNFI